MKILLDENVPQKLRLLIEGDHTVVTVWFQGWSGLTNGALLKASEEAGFELFITADQVSAKPYRPKDGTGGSEYEQLGGDPSANCRGHHRD